MARQIVVYFVRNKAVKSAPVTEEGSRYARHIDPSRGENISTGEAACVQFWQGQEAGNFFVMQTAEDVLTMIGMAAKANSTYEWMACDAEQLGVPT